MKTDKNTENRKEKLRERTRKGIKNNSCKRTIDIKKRIKRILKEIKISEDIYTEKNANKILVHTRNN